MREYTNEEIQIVSDNIAECEMNGLLKVFRANELDQIYCIEGRWMNAGNIDIILNFANKKFLNQVNK